MQSFYGNRFARWATFLVGSWTLLGCSSADLLSVRTSVDARSADSAFADVERVQTDRSAKRLPPYSANEAPVVRDVESEAMRNVVAVRFTEKSDDSVEDEFHALPIEPARVTRAGVRFVPAEPASGAEQPQERTSRATTKPIQVAVRRETPRHVDIDPPATAAAAERSPRTFVRLKVPSSSKRGPSGPVAANPKPAVDMRDKRDDAEKVVRVDNSIFAPPSAAPQSEVEAALRAATPKLRKARPKVKAAPRATAQKTPDARRQEVTAPNIVIFKPLEMLRREKQPKVASAPEPRAARRQVAAAPRGTARKTPDVRRQEVTAPNIVIFKPLEMLRKETQRKIASAPKPRAARRQVAAAPRGTARKTPDVRRQEVTAPNIVIFKPLETLRKETQRKIASAPKPQEARRQVAVAPRAVAAEPHATRASEKAAPRVATSRPREAPSQAAAEPRFAPPQPREARQQIKSTPRVVMLRPRQDRRQAAAAPPVVEPETHLAQSQATAAPRAVTPWPTEVRRQVASAPPAAAPESHPAQRQAVAAPRAESTRPREVRHQMASAPRTAPPDSRDTQREAVAAPRATTSSPLDARRQVAAAPRARETRPPRSSLGLVARQSQQHIHYAFDLAQRGAIFTAREEFARALKLVAQSLDARDGTLEHAESLDAGLRALDEAQDFVARGSLRDVTPDMPRVIAMHRTPVLKDARDQEISPLIALQRYYGYARTQLVAAVGGEPVASEALYGLARVQVDPAAGPGAERATNGPRAIALHQAAIMVDPRNYRAANELGVLLARYGKLEAAKEVLLHSVSVAPQAESQYNLLVVYRELGETDQARRAEAEYRHLRAAKQQLAESEHGTPYVRYVDPATFAGASTLDQADLITKPVPQRPREQAKPASPAPKGFAKFFSPLKAMTR